MGSEMCIRDSGYVDLLSDGDAWLPSGRLTHNASLFYLPSAALDPFGLTTTLTWDAEGLALLSVEDPAGLVVSATIDYQRLAPTTVTDPNGTESSATFDPLGRVLTTSVRNGAEGDGTGEHSIELHYDTDTLPASVHTKLLKEYGGTDWLESWAYSDGGGNIIQTKVQAAPGDAPTVSGGVVTWGAADPRFIGTGRVILDNKGNVIKQYEPFFSTTSAYEDEAELVEWGVCAVHNYDPLGRNIQVTLPDGHTQTWTYGPWSVEAHDEEDNRSGGDHEGTPTTTHLDTLGRVYKLVERPDASTTHTTRIELDILGNALDVIDPRGNRLQARIYDLLGHALFTGAADEGYTPSSSRGETRILPDASGTPLRSWRSGGLSLRPLHDAARRPIGLLVDEGAGERLVALSIFGDAVSDLPSTNHALGRPVHVYDTAGRVTLTYDLKGRVTAQTRTLLADITTEADWSGLESEGSLADIATWLSTDASVTRRRSGLAHRRAAFAVLRLRVAGQRGHVPFGMETLAVDAMRARQEIAVELRMRPRRIQHDAVGVGQRHDRQRLGAAQGETELHGERDALAGDQRRRQYRMHAATAASLLALQDRRGGAGNAQGGCADQAAHVGDADVQPRCAERARTRRIGVGQTHVEGGIDAALPFVDPHLVQAALADRGQHASMHVHRLREEQPLAVDLAHLLAQHASGVAFLDLHLLAIRHHQHRPGQALFAGIAAGDLVHRLLAVLLPLGDGAADHRQRNQDRQHQHDHHRDLQTQAHDASPFLWRGHAGARQ